MEPDNKPKLEIDRKFKWGLVIIFITLALTSVIPFKAISWTHASQKDLLKSHEYIDDLSDLLSLVKDAETGQRGFAITGRESFLTPYYQAVSRMEATKNKLKADMGGIGSSPETMGELFSAIDLKFKELAETIEARRSGGFQAAEPIISSERGKRYMDRIREIVAEEVARENRRNALLSEELEFRTETAAYVGLASTMTDLILLAFLLRVMFRLLKERKTTAMALEKSTRELSAGFNELEKRNNEIALMAEMARALEAVATVKETYSVIAIFCAKLLTSSGGALYLFRNSRDLLEREAEWGSIGDMPEAMEPRDCWALRQGRPHFVTGSGDLCCPHYHESGNDLKAGYLCIPLIAQSEVLGLICLEFAEESSHAAGMMENENDLARAVSEQIALGLSNAKLREVLQQQSIIDPLTGLFNRRYMDETLKREIARSVRKSTQLSIILLDIDHFKKVNDTYGHEMGDMVLSAVSNRIKSGIRNCDLACRFGGEELVLILPDCDKAAAIQRAEKLREEIARLSVQRGNQQLNHVTASFGVATFPDDGEIVELLFHAADQAMYSAKNTGRNRVVAATQTRADIPQQ